MRIVNEVAEGIARSRAGERIAELSEQKREVVRRLVAKGIANGWTNDELADRLAGKVGLHQRYADAVENYRTGLLAQGKFTPAQVRKMADEYAQRLRAQRALGIATYEVQKALNDAQRMLWQQMREDGDVSRWAVRKWVLHKDERLCSVCRPMQGVRASLNEGRGYNVKGYGFIEGPPVHPNCRCTEVLVDEGIAKAEDYRELWSLPRTMDEKQ